MCKEFCQVSILDILSGFESLSFDVNCNLVMSVIW